MRQLFFTNIQGDVIAIIDTAGTQVTSYIYDAWGNITRTGGPDTGLAQWNPLRYRGYVYDTETRLYYLQSRYYNPKVGRFINADVYVSTGQGFTGNNMFAYCLNNPVNFVDRNGENPEPLAAWLSSMWWLCGVDGVLPIGEVVYVGAAVIIGVATIGIIDDAFAVGEEFSKHLIQQQSSNIFMEEEKEGENGVDVPNVTYPGDDPTQAPEGTTWKGKGPQGGKQGNYYNPNTGESWHPDLDHPDPIGPHWDYNYRGSGVSGWRVLPGGIVIPKLVVPTRTI